MVSLLSPLPLRGWSPLGGAPPDGKRAFWRGGAQVWLRGTAYPETLPNSRRGGTLGRLGFSGFAYLLAAAGGNTDCGPREHPHPPPFGGTFPLEGGRLGGRQWGRSCKRVQTLPPHPVQCAHWTTFPPRGRVMVRCMKGVQNLLPFPSGEDYVAPEALARQLRRSPKTATATNFAYPWPQWARKETQASTPDFARRK